MTIFLKKPILFVLFLLIGSQLIFSQTDEQKIALEKQVSGYVSTYKSVCAFTETFDAISANYVTQFKKLFEADAEIYSDIEKTESPTASLSVEKYVDFVQAHYRIGFTVEDVAFEFLTIEESTADDKKDRKANPYMIKVYVQKSFFGYYDDINYIERNPGLIFVFKADKNYKLSSKIVKIEPTYAQQLNVTGNLIKNLESDKPDAAKKQAVEKQIADLEKQLAAAKLQLEKFDSSATDVKLSDLKNQKKDLKIKASQEAELNRNYKK